MTRPARPDALLDGLRALVRDLVAEEVHAALAGAAQLEPRLDVRAVEPPSLRRRLYSAARRGQLVGEQVGTALYLRRAEVEAWLAARRLAPLDGSAPEAEADDLDAVFGAVPARKAG